MTNTNLEICRIRQVTDKAPLRMDVYFVAERISDLGAEIIASSDILTSKYMGYGWAPPTVKLLGPMSEKLHEQLAHRLVMDGWEPVQKDKNGIAVELKRAVKKVVAQPEGPASLLGYLMILLDAGILTPEEFEAKKALVMKRVQAGV